METGVADFNKGKAALVTATKYENPFGVYVTGIDRTEEPDNTVLKSRKKTFSYLGAVMTLPTGVQAVALSKIWIIRSIARIHKKASSILQLRLARLYVRSVSRFWYDHASLEYLRSGRSHN